ncbi:hypothetical protein F5146DRAFT_1001399 [Armillaria mellea]|nr:hypothetical protein F5146DRAFT_1001399 [Armillaria mellea]
MSKTCELKEARPKEAGMSSLSLSEAQADVGACTLEAINSQTWLSFTSPPHYYPIHRLRVVLLLLCTGLTGLRVPLHHTTLTDVVYSQSSSALYALDPPEPTSTQTGQDYTPGATQTKYNVAVNSDTIVHSAGSPSLAASTSPRSQKDIAPSVLAIILPIAGITAIISALLCICDCWEKLRQRSREIRERMGEKLTKSQTLVGEQYMKRLPSPVMLSLVDGLKEGPSCRSIRGGKNVSLQTMVDWNNNVGS